MPFPGSACGPVLAGLLWSPWASPADLPFSRGPSKAMVFPRPAQWKKDLLDHPRRGPGYAQGEASLGPAPAPSTSSS